MSGGKRPASLSPLKPRISANLDGRQLGPSHGVQNEPDIAAGATSASTKPLITGKKTQSMVKAANEAAEAMNVLDGVSGCGGKTPTSLAGQSAMLGAARSVQACLQGAADKPGCPPERVNVRRAKSCHRADSDKLEDASTECKEAGGARDGIFNNNNEHEEDNEDAEDDEESEGKASGDDPDDEEDAELALLCQEMDAKRPRAASRPSRSPTSLGRPDAGTPHEQPSLTAGRSSSGRQGRGPQTGLPARWREAERQNSPSALIERGRTPLGVRRRAPPPSPPSTTTRTTGPTSGPTVATERQERPRCPPRARPASRSQAAMRTTRTMTRSCAWAPQNWRCYEPRQPPSTGTALSSHTSMGTTLMTTRV
jgi:hypothetical protein